MQISLQSGKEWTERTFKMSFFVRPKSGILFETPSKFVNSDFSVQNAKFRDSVRPFFVQNVFVQSL